MQRVMVLVELPEAAVPAAAFGSPPRQEASAEDASTADRRRGRERRGTFSLDSAPPPNGKWEARPYVFRAFRDRRGGAHDASERASDRQAAADAASAAGSAAVGAGVHVVAAHGSGGSGGDEPAVPPGWIDLNF